MRLVQRDLGALPLTFIAFYLDTGTGAISVGDNVCYKHDEDITAGADEWAELERFKVVAKPVTANLNFYAGVVVDIVRRQGTGTDYSSFVRIQAPNHGSVMQALNHANATAGATFLKLANNDWGLVAETTPTTRTVSTVAVAGETANTSSTAAVKLTYGLT